MKQREDNHNRIIISLCAYLLSCLSLPAQNTTNLPTSMYGIGELNSADGGRYAGLGNMGIALNRPGFQNTLNPAAITAMDTASFTFDIGLSASYARYSFLSDRSSNLTGNPNRLSLGFRVLPRWYALIGAAPYSSVGYLIQTEEEVEGMPGEYLYSTFEGTGGLYRFYATNAFALTSRLSIGINLGMIMGTVTQSETQESATVSYESSKRAFYTDFGLHYRLGGPGRSWEVGAVFAPSLRIAHDNRLTYSNSSTSEDVDKSYHSRTQYLPMHIGAVYLTEPRKPRSTELRAGIGVSNSYINLKGGKMYYLEGNVGVSFPLRESFLSLGATWRRQVNQRDNLMQESRFSLNLNLTFGEKLIRFKIK